MYREMSIWYIETCPSLKLCPVFSVPWRFHCRYFWTPESLTYMGEVLYLKSSLTSSTQVGVHPSPSDGGEGAQVTSYLDDASISQTRVDVTYGGGRERERRGRGEQSEIEDIVHPTTVVIVGVHSIE